MPELPEVESIARGLRPAIVGRTIIGVRLGKTDFMDDPAAVERELPGKRITKVERYGKFLVLRLEEGSGTNGNGNLALAIHLGMTGQIVARRAEEPKPPHTHAVFALDDGRELRYTDIRRFGRMAVVGDEALEKIIGPLGADPTQVSEEEFCARIGGRRARVKALLMDQRVLRGMGNIYTDESLWRARIHPARIGARLTRDQARRLWRAVQSILKEAIRLRGSSISDYVDANGETGDYQSRHRAYGREGKNCFRCWTKIRRITVAGRSSYFCPRCQRAPRGNG